ncbi:MAG: hypothetical protein ABIP74_03420, partial [Candidatus Saccharimonas sp.]
MSGPRQVGTTADTVRGHGFISPVGTNYSGIPMFLDMRDKSVVNFDPWWLKNNDYIGATIALITGVLNAGKSALIKMMVLRLALYVIGYEVFRVTINDRKPEGTEGEYGALSRLFGCVPYIMRERRVNPFERRLFLRNKNDSEVYALALVSLAETLCEYDDHPLTSKSRLSLRVAMFGMLTMYSESNWSPELLRRIAGSLTREMFEGYLKTLDQQLITETTTRLELVKKDPSLVADMEKEIRDLTDSSWNYTYEEITEGGKDIANRLGHLLGSESGEMFGADHSIYEMLTQRLVDKDWRGLSDKSETLMHIIENKIKMTAGELNRTDLLPHAEVSDELHRSMDNLLYARTQAYFTEIARSMPTFFIFSTHSYNSIRKGGVGSELYGLANKILQNTPLMFYGSPPRDQLLLAEYQAREELTNREARRLAHLEPQVFGVKYGEQQPFMFVHPLATAFERRYLLGTNSASEGVENRPSPGNNQQMELFA